MSRQIDPTVLLKKPQLVAPYEVQVEKYDLASYIPIVNPSPERSLSNVEVRMNDNDKFLEIQWRQIVKQIELLNINCQRPYNEVINEFEIGTTEDVKTRMYDLFIRLRGQPFNAELYDQTSCLLQALASRAAEGEAQSRYADEIACGENGCVYAGLFAREYAPIIFPAGQSPPFVVKSPSGDDESDILNEAIVGLYATNGMRTQFPTFMHTFGLFRARRPDPDGEYLFSDAGDAPYLMVETIVGETLSKFLKNDMTKPENLRRYYEIIAQVFLALSYAKAKTGFVHNDLSCENVMIQTLPRRASIRFPGTGGRPDLYVETDVVARIIDFGRAQALIPVDNPESGELFAPMSSITPSGRIFDGMFAPTSASQQYGFWTGAVSWRLGLEPGKSSSVYDVGRLLGTSIAVAGKPRFRLIMGDRSPHPIGYEFLTTLTSSGVLTDDVFLKWGSLYFTAPFGVDIDPRAVLDSGLAAARDRCRSAGSDLVITESPTAPLFACSGSCSFSLATSNERPITLPVTPSSSPRPVRL